MTRSVPTYALYGEDSAQDPRFWLHCETIPWRSSRHDWRIGLHRHRSFFQILYIAAGSGEATFGARRHVFGPPSVITVPPAVNHGFSFARDIDGLVITILNSYLDHPPGDLSRLGDWLAQPRLTQLDAQAGDDAYVMQTLARLGEEFENARPGRNEVMAGYVSLALRLTARISQKGAAGDLAPGSRERRMEIFNDLLGEHFRAHRPAAFYANALGISPAQLNRIVRTMTGRTTHEAIAAKLVGAAKRELVFTLHSVQEISHRLGFSDPAYFSRFFSRQTGETPRVWREKEKDRLEMSGG